MFYVYILRSKRDRGLYIGYTNDLRRRVKEHNSGSTRSTKARKPFELVYYEAYKSQRDAKHREKALKLFGRARESLKRRLIDTLKS
ncbi:MAG TPA: GIY-YIG nuclease family protein [Candidatus Paceibacterota bacterium]